MANLTRRGLLRRAALGTAATGALMVAPTRTFAHSSAMGSASMTLQQSQARTSIDARVPLGAYVHDPSSGQITLLLGTREVTIHDPDLVRRLVQAVR